MTFKFLEVLQVFVKVLSHMWGREIFQGHLFQAGPEERQRRKRWGVGGVELEWGEGGGRWWARRKLEWSTLNLLNQILAPGYNCPAAVLGVTTAATKRPN